MEKVSSIIYMSISILIIIVIVALIGSSMYNYASYGTKEGVIVDKNYQRAYISTSYTTSYVGDSTIRIPTQQYHPETYNIQIQKENNNKIMTCWIQVTADEYNNLKIGDYYGR